MQDFRCPQCSQPAKVTGSKIKFVRKFGRRARVCCDCAKSMQEEAERFLDGTTSKTARRDN